MRKNVYVRIPANWLSDDYDLFPMRIRNGEVVLCTKNPYRYSEEVFKIVPVRKAKNKSPKEGTACE